MGSRSRWIFEFEASLFYRVSSRTARATQRNPVSKKQKQTKNNNDYQKVRRNQKYQGVFNSTKLTRKHIMNYQKKIDSSKMVLDEKELDRLMRLCISIHTIVVLTNVKLTGS